ncbi:MAG TPA: hypothetical protein VMN36_18605, partial [Verrucomicrobiales bacterium]|nr:hypothetical protein [Verrucomicrobiales bacterium]
ESGKILAGFRGDRPRLLAGSRELQPASESPPRRVAELDQWLQAVRGGKPSSASFENVRRLCETIHTGNIALRINRKLEWDADRRRFSNSEEANKLLRRGRYRPGWDVFG